MVLTLINDTVASPEWLEGLDEDPRVAIGELRGSRIALTIETPDKSGDEAAWDWLKAVPGVLQIELACVLYPDDEAPRRGDPAADAQDGGTTKELTEPAGGGARDEGAAGAAREQGRFE